MGHPVHSELFTVTDLNIPFVFAKISAKNQVCQYFYIYTYYVCMLQEIYSEFSSIDRTGQKNSNYRYCVGVATVTKLTTIIYRVSRV